MRRIKKIPLRILALTLCICLCIGMGVVAHAANGDACVSTPGCMGAYYNGICFICGKDEAAVYNTEKDYYEISNAGQLFWFAEKINSGELARNTNAVLTVDIDLEGRDWITIAETGLYNNEYGTDDGYAGTFDGQNHVIKNLDLHSSTTGMASCGLFGTLSGTVKNLGIVGVTFVDGGYDIRAGAVAGQVIKTGTVRNCYVIGAKIKPGEHVTGGIAGCVYDGTIENCYVLDSEIDGTANRYGYIVGDSRADGSDTDRRGTVRNCYTNATPAWSTRTGYIETCKQIHDASFRTGEIAYLLSQGTDGSVWGQNDLTETGYPVLGGTSVPATRYEFLGQNLNIGSDLSLKYHILAYYDWTDFKVSSSQSDSFACGLSESKLGMRFEFNTVATTVTEQTDGGIAPYGATAYAFTFAGISPQCLGDGIDAYITFNNEDRASFKGYTVEQNLKQLQIDHAEDSQLMELIDKLLKYGHASEVYTGYNSMATDYVASDSSATPPAAELPTLGTYITGYTVRFGNENYIKIKCENLPTGYTVSSEMTEGIAPTDFDKDYTFKVMNGESEVESITLSVNDYLYAISVSDDNSENMTNMKALATALYNYGVAANGYAETNTAEVVVTLPVTSTTSALTLSNAVKSAVDGGAKAIIISGATELTAEQQTAVAEALANATVIVYFDSMSSESFTATLPETVSKYGTNSDYFLIDNTYYVISSSGLGTAISATSNPTIKLVADITYAASANPDSTTSYTLDINGKTLTFSDMFQIKGGDVIVKDSDPNGNGKVIGNGNYVLVVSAGSLTINSGNFETASGNPWGIIGLTSNGGGICTIEGGSFTSNGKTLNRAFIVPGNNTTTYIKGNPTFASDQPAFYTVDKIKIDLSGATGGSYVIYFGSTTSVTVILPTSGWAMYNSSGNIVTSPTSKNTYTIKPVE